ncbi:MULTISPECIES: GNAT family N-acetyltransferase [Rhodopseudomonas]|uniref:GNAT family N-acetyltransferase n=1 Tax=Rhodopseudomonas TaxID=1073 RepID=UPI0005C91FA8|nr:MULTISPECIES: GNAT family N-acetyltransferase [Rhodopseudomonas]MDF3808892.1 GNAT family N-acetyltransferase [Rhodopseudomonas sp. BAL398]WOK18522.1 GNAT family N-acetyltransferase [Rhodopseudomonas sp. BAL398]
MISVSICSPDFDLGANWDDLVGRASPNAFMNPAALKAAHDTGFARIHLLLAWDDGVTPRRLAGLWALQARRPFALWPMLLEALPHAYAFLSSPVLDPAYADRVMPAFLAAIAADPALPNVVSLRSFNAESPACAALHKLLTENGNPNLTLDQQARPIVTREAGVKRSGSTRKKLRQDWNRLAALGSVELVNDRTQAGVSQALESFLALEAASWKGARGTAILCDRHDTAFVRRLVGELAARGDASVALLCVDGRAIAAQVLMYCGTAAYTWKIGFDAEFAKYSPGALLVDKLTEELFAGPDIMAIDSCSVQASFMAQLWTGRRQMVDLLIAAGPDQTICFALEAGRQRGYYWLRGLRNRLRAWRNKTQPVRAAAASPAS